MQAFAKRMSENVTSEYTKTLLEGMQVKQNNFLKRATSSLVHSKNNTPR